MQRSRLEWCKEPNVLGLHDLNYPTWGNSDRLVIASTIFTRIFSDSMLFLRFFHQSIENTFLSVVKKSAFCDLKMRENEHKQNDFLENDPNYPHTTLFAVAKKRFTGLMMNKGNMTSLPLYDSR